MSLKTIAAVAASASIVAGAIWFGHKYYNYFAQDDYPRAAILKDKAVAWTSLESYREFRKELKQYEGEQAGAFAASWITSDRVALLPAQQAKIMGMDGPLVVIRTLDGDYWFVTPSQLEDDEEQPDGEIEDRIAQMIAGR